jgi:prepilin-type processing-associated H-X9-DG protein
MGQRRLLHVLQHGQTSVNILFVDGCDSVNVEASSGREGECDCDHFTPSFSSVTD